MAAGVVEPAARAATTPGIDEAEAGSPRLLSLVSPADLLEFGSRSMPAYRGVGFVERYETIRRGQSLTGLLALHDVSPERARAFADAVGTVHDVDRLQPGRWVSLFFERGTEQLEAIEYSVDDHSVLVVERKTDGGLEARIARRPTSVEIRGVSGTINDGMQIDCSQAGVPERIVRELGDLFAWDVDFDSMEAGDTFRALYEVAVGEDGEVVQTGAIVAAEVESGGRVHQAIYHADADGRAAYFDAAGRSLDRGQLRYPLEFVRISSEFSGARFHPVLHRTRAHKGVDFAAPTGTPVRAVADGWVTRSGWQGQLGFAVRVEHGDGRGLTSVYGHLSRIARTALEGAVVRKGEIIGYVGRTGCATGPHLHFSLLDGEEYLDPLALEAPPRIPAVAPNGSGFERSRGVLLAALDTLRSDGPVRLSRIAARPAAPAAAPVPRSY